MTHRLRLEWSYEGEHFSRKVVEDADIGDGPHWLDNAQDALEDFLERSDLEVFLEVRKKHREWSYEGAPCTCPDCLEAPK